MIDGFHEKSYLERLRETNLLSLEMRRLRADLIEVFKIVHGMEGLTPDLFFQIRNDERLRGHCFTIVKQRAHLNLRKFFFSNRILTEWNNLPSSAVTSTTINGFKNAIKPLMEQMGELFISQRRLAAPVLLSRSDV